MRMAKKPGDKPTERQVKYLKDLAAQRGQTVDPESMTKEEAAQKIQDYLCPSEPPTPKQRREIGKLARRLECEADVPLTRGQADWLIYLVNTFLRPRSA